MGSDINIMGMFNGGPEEDKPKKKKVKKYKKPIRIVERRSVIDLEATMLEQVQQRRRSTRRR